VVGYHAAAHRWVVALVGFGSAYVRARYGEKLHKWLWQLVVRFARWSSKCAKILGNPQRQHIYAAGIASAEAFGDGPVVKVGPAPFELDASLPLPEQVDLIAKYAKAIADNIPRLNAEVQRLDGRVDQVGSGATEFTESSVAELRRECTRSSSASAGQCWTCDGQSSVWVSPSSVSSSAIGPQRRRSSTGERALSPLVKRDLQAGRRRAPNVAAACDYRAATGYQGGHASPGPYPNGLEIGAFGHVRRCTVNALTC
jgi:hypothetical protein